MNPTRFFNRDHQSVVANFQQGINSDFAYGPGDFIQSDHNILDDASEIQDQIAMHQTPVSTNNYHSTPPSTRGHHNTPTSRQMASRGNIISMLQQQHSTLETQKGLLLSIKEKQEEQAKEIEVQFNNIENKFEEHMQMCFGHSPSRKWIKVPRSLLVS